MISVVVPTINREDCLYKMLQSLDSQSYKDFEVLVIDQSETVSEKKISRILNSCKNIHFFQINKRGRCLAKNFAIDQTKGDIVLFCDDDIIVDENFIAEHVRVHAEVSDVAAVSCHLIEPHEKEIHCKMPLEITRFGRFVNKANAIYNGYVTSLNGGNMSFKKSALQKVGYFDENFHGTSMLEEPDIALRLLNTGYKIYFSSQSKVKHFPQHNGNIGVRNAKKYQWQRDYYFNQYFFMFRNKRSMYLPLIFVYLLYRTFIESIKNRAVSLKFLLLPVSSFKEAKYVWKQARSNYPTEWYTPKRAEVEILKHMSTQYAFL